MISAEDKEYSLVIPVLDDRNNRYLDSLVSSLHKQTLPPKEVHLVIGDRRQGRAINYGVKQCTTKYIGTVDDDTQIDDPGLFKKIIEEMEKDPSIGLGGAACGIPATATAFQKRAMTEIPRRLFPVQEKSVDSDMVQHPCLIIPRDLFLEIGGEDELIIRGLDPVLRKKVRDAGKRVVIIAGTSVYHMLPETLWKLLKMYYRNGRGSAFAHRNYPWKILELSDGFDKGSFIEKRSFGYRIFRRLVNLFLCVLKFQFIRFAVDISYVFGFIMEELFPGYETSSPVEKIETEIKNNETFTVHYHRVRISRMPSHRK